MVLLHRGRTRCSLCGDALRTDDEIVGFPAFLSREHRLWRYSDSAMDASCFANWAEKSEFEAQFAEAEERRRTPWTPELLEEDRRRQAIEREVRLRADREHNERHSRIMARVREFGARCPHCGDRTKSYRELDGTARLRLACGSCGRSCNADELIVDEPK